MPRLQIQTTGLEQYAPGGNATLKVMIIGGPGAGKSLPLDTFIATPNGWTTMGELFVGAEVIGSDGQATTVTGVFDQGVRPAYKVTFNDGSTAICDAEHEWTVQSAKAREKGLIGYPVTVQQMLDSGVTRARSEERKDRYKFFLPLVQPVQYEKIELPLDPYLLGTLLANGSLTNDVIDFSTNDQEIAERIFERNPHLSIRESTRTGGTVRKWAIHKLHGLLQHLEIDQTLSAEKRVPPLYLSAHEQARRDLLAGLLDGDGSVQRGRRARYTSTSFDLALDVQTLVQSLGGVAQIFTEKRGEHTVSLWMPSNPFYLTRKAEDYNPRPWFRAVASIEPAEAVEMRCIKVAAEDQLYLIDEYLLTHNTRFSSFWPAPIYMNCESGLASVADRKVPFVDVNSSQDALDVLAMLRQECSRPMADRRFKTVVVDTLDAFQRKVKDEWLLANPGSQSFRGFDAWGYLDTKMQMLLTRLLNLDMNVIVLAHYTDKTITEGVGDNATQRQEFQLQLSGAVKDSVFNDFDLVGFMGRYYESVEGQKVEKRGLTFKSTAEKPFLKDRLHVTPPWMEVRFADEDYADLFSAVIGRLDDIGESQVIGEVEPSTDASLLPAGGVVGPQSGGALPPPEPSEQPLPSYDRPTLNKIARDLGLKPAANTIKSELIEMIEKARAQAKGDAAGASPQPAPQPQMSEAEQRSTAAAVADPKTAAPTPVQAPAATVQPEKAQQADTPAVLDTSLDTTLSTPVQQPEVSSIETEVGAVDPKTGEIAAPMTEQQVVAAVGGTVLSVHEHTDNQPVAQASVSTATPSAAPATTEVCSSCGKDLSGENQDYVKLSKIKYRRPLCNAEYQAAKKNGAPPPAMAR